MRAEVEKDVQILTSMPVTTELILPLMDSCGWPG